MITQVIEKSDGLGPYFYVLVWKHSRTNELMTSVYSTWDDLETRRQALHENGIDTQWDLGVDYTRKTRVCTGKMDAESMRPDIVPYSVSG